MVSFNPLTVILKENNLDGTNFADWKRDLNIILTAEEHGFVLIEECPLEADADSTPNEVKEFRTWKKSDEMARYCNIRNFLFSVIFFFGRSPS
ncbi:hypothetical protein OROMI_025210 [Orobanche minor]